MLAPYPEISLLDVNKSKEWKDSDITPLCGDIKGVSSHAIRPLLVIYGSLLTDCL